MTTGKRIADKNSKKDGDTSPAQQLDKTFDSAAYGGKDGPGAYERIVRKSGSLGSMRDRQRMASAQVRLATQARAGDTRV